MGEFEIARDQVTPGAGTTGTLLVEGTPFCFTLELPWRGNAPDISCVPAGIYPVRLLPSARWGRPMPHIQNVPDRSEIEIHIGNYLTDTDGCVLLGNYFNGAVLMESRMAFDKFMEWFQSCGYTASLKITEETTPRPMETS